MRQPLWLAAVASWASLASYPSSIAASTTPASAGQGTNSATARARAASID